MNDAVEVPDYIDDERPEVKAAWRPETLADVEWMLQRIGELETVIAENEAVCEARVKQLRARTDQLNAVHQRGVSFFSTMLRWFCETNKAALLKNGKAKSRKFQSGTVAWRTKPATPVIQDKEKLLAWAQSQPIELGFLRIKEEPAWERVRGHVLTSGELPPGVDLLPEEERFDIKTLTKKDEVQ